SLLPPTGAKTFKVRSRIYGDDGLFNIIYSNQTLYSQSNMTDYYSYFTINTNTAPYASGVSITNPNNAKVGQTISGSYTFNDDDLDLEGTSTFRWLKAESLNGYYSPIDGATAQDYTVQPADAEHYLKFEVTPVADGGTNPGTAVLSEASPQVTEAASTEIMPYPQTFYETTSNNGSLGEVYVAVILSNATYVQGTISGVTMTGLPAGLSVGSITRRSATEIRVYFSGTATAHEYANSVLYPNTVTVTIPSSMLKGVTADLTTTNGFYVQFSNNPATDLAVSAVGKDWVELSWDAPDGLSGASTGLQYYKVYRNDVYIAQVNHNSAKGEYSYQDTSLSTGTANVYKIQAYYSLDGAPYTETVSGTPLGFSAYAITSPSANGSIDHDEQTISVILPYGTDLTNLVASFTAPGATVKIGSTTQTSGSTANNYTDPISYTLSSIDGCTTDYTVSIQSTLAAPTLPETSFQETTSSFTAKWNSVSGATSYELDVASNSGFSSFLSGFEDLDMGGATSCVINNLSANTEYYYRVRAIAADPLLNSTNSETGSILTLYPNPGAGSTVITNSDATTINMGSFDTGTQGVVNPYLIVDPDSFVSGADNSLSVSMSYGSYPQGLLFNLSFENPTIGNGTLTISYSGLLYDPTEVFYSIGGGGLAEPASLTIDSENDLIILSIAGLSKDAKAAYELQIVTNDETGDTTLPIELSSFTALMIANGTVRLDWTTQSESGMMGYHILRNTSPDLATAIMVSPLIEATNTSNAVTYSFTDDEIMESGTYHFWLQATDFDSLISHYGPLAVQVSMGSEEPEIVIPLITTLKKPYPNPFNPVLNITYDLATIDHVEIKIYNSRGQLVKNLVDSLQQAKNHRIVWDGRDNSGREVATGTYLISMKAGTYSSFTKAVMLK
ncbi:MAG: T9SS type A sorting domain-containing protein, partial [Candidatus Cloacimonetes bacterium]|nr:T9SS type A sorting domain-containing protein [Candidatus Cloacimonadota bacterium]